MISPKVSPERIDAAYRELGYKAGWRFMTCPIANFSTPKVLLISLNPSGSVEHGPRWSQEEGSAYVIESWDRQAPGRDTLQVQIQRLISHLGCSFEQVASAHFVPFRSPRWADLTRPKEALHFARLLWADFSQSMSPEYVICLGTTVGKYAPAMFGVNQLTRSKTGWGNISLAVGRTRTGGQLAVLPHLGTFKLFSRDACMPFLKTALGPESVIHA